MHGPLSEIGLVEVLQLLERGQRSGVLRVVGPDASMPRIIRLVAGRVAALDPDAGDAALQRALVQRHVAAEDDSDATSVPAAEHDALRWELARRALGTMLHWDRGRFDFQVEPVTSGPLDAGVDALVMGLVAAESRRVELAPHLEGFRAVPVFVDAARASEGGFLALDVLHWRVLDAVDGERDVAALAAGLGEPIEDVAQRVLMLTAAAILELRAPPPDAASTVAGAAIQSGRYDDAVSRFRDRVVAVPDDDEAWRTLGLAEVGAGRFDRAIAAWDEWAAVRPDRADAALALIRAARMMMETLGETRD